MCQNCLIQLIHAIYANDSVKIIIVLRLSKNTLVNQGMRQEDPLFKMVLNIITEDLEGLRGYRPLTCKTLLTHFLPVYPHFLKIMT